MNVGYARVSSKTQNLKTEMFLMEQVGCDKIFSEKETGTKNDRKAFSELMSFVRDGDTVFFSRVDRIGRNMFDIISNVNKLIEKNVTIVCIEQPHADTRTSAGRFFFINLSAYAELENDLRKNRIEAARRAGRVGGRPKGLTKEAQAKVKKVGELYPLKNDAGTPKHSISEIMKIVGISKRTFYKYLQESGIVLDRLF